MDSSTVPHRLITLGRIALETPAGEDAELRQRKRKLALLAVLALSPEPFTRDALTEMFWGDEDPERARHSLSDALSHLRRVLGRDVIAGRRELVQLDATGRMSVDALELEAAFAARDYLRVRELYAGPFLDNFSVDSSDGFERWAAPMRARYAYMFAEASAPPPRTVQRRSRRPLYTAIGISVAAAIGFAVALVYARGASARSATTPVVALTDVWTDPADTSLAWLGEGLKQMIAADLGRVSSAGVVSPAVAREAAGAGTHADSLDERQSIALANRLHADWAASATIARRQTAYVVSLTLRDVDHPGAVKRYTMSGDNILAVADQAAAHILSAVDASGVGPRLSEVETSNTEAYRHFIRSEDARADGRTAESIAELDSAIAADSGFTSAIVARLHSGSYELYRRLRPLFDRARPHMAQWDVRTEAIFLADHGGAPDSAEALARQLVARYARDPRALRKLAELYTEHARYAAAESTYLRLIALDATTPVQNGPCWACDAWNGLSHVRHDRGDFAGEIEVARRMTALRPSSPAPWRDLAGILALSGDIAGSDAAAARFHLLDPGERFNDFIARLLIVDRRYDQAEEYARRYLRSAQRDEAYDALEAIARERGQYRKALNVFDAWRANGDIGESSRVYAHTLGALGEDGRARDLLEHSAIHPSDTSTRVNFGEGARGFAWVHALEADATWTRTDTVALRAIADSIQRIGAWSYYARDWTVYHHVRGLIAERAGRLTEARDEFEQSLSLVPGWTRSNIELAKVDIALGAPDRAIATLRQAYHQTPDAMGRYAPRSQLDYQMALAFARKNQLDSARIYATWVRAAWVHADPEFTRQLAALP